MMLQHLKAEDPNLGSILEQALFAHCPDCDHIMTPYAQTCRQSVFDSCLLFFFFVVVVNCGSPKNLTNGVFSYLNESANNEYQSVISYQCNEPYYHIVTGTGGGESQSYRLQNLFLESPLTFPVRIVSSPQP